MKEIKVKETDFKKLIQFDLTNDYKIIKDKNNLLKGNKIFISDLKEIAENEIYSLNYILSNDYEEYHYTDQDFSYDSEIMNSENEEDKNKKEKEILDYIPKNKENINKNKPYIN